MVQGFGALESLAGMNSLIGSWMLAGDETSQALVSNLMDLQGVTGPSKTAATARPGALRLVIDDDSAVFGRAKCMGAPYLLDGQWHQQVTRASAARYGAADYQCKERTSQRIAVTIVLPHETSTPTEWVFLLGNDGLSLRCIVTKVDRAIQAHFVRTESAGETSSLAGHAMAPRQQQTRSCSPSLRTLPERKVIRSKRSPAEGSGSAARARSTSGARKASSSPTNRSNPDNLVPSAPTASLDCGALLLFGLGYSEQFSTLSASTAAGGRGEGRGEGNCGTSACSSRRRHGSTKTKGDEGSARRNKEASSSQGSCSRSSSKGRGHSSSTRAGRSRPSSRSSRRDHLGTARGGRDSSMSSLDMMLLAGRGLV